MGSREGGKGSVEDASWKKGRIQGEREARRKRGRQVGKEGSDSGKAIGKQGRSERGMQAGKKVLKASREALEGGRNQ
jgi:predicted RNA-binding protein YlqC (UPF0109 family)